MTRLFLPCNKTILKTNIIFSIFLTALSSLLFIGELESNNIIYFLTSSFIIWIMTGGFIIYNFCFLFRTLPKTGESRYLEVKLVLNLDALFVLLDEPFNGISPIHIDLLKKMILDKSSKKGIILTDHDYRNVLDVANKYFLLFDGGLKTIRTKQDLIDWGYVPENK